jgi:DNA-binding response OmpR family regulator
LSDTATLQKPPLSKETVNILMVDDSPDKLLAMESILQSLGTNLVKAHSGPEALRALLKQEFAVILLDVNMPGMDGFEILSSIRKEQLPVRVVMLTARRRESDVLRGFELGADDYILKPFNPLELGARLKRLM